MGRGRALQVADRGARTSSGARSTSLGRAKGRKRTGTSRRASTSKRTANTVATSTGAEGMVCVAGQEGSGGRECWLSVLVRVVTGAVHAGCLPSSSTIMGSTETWTGGDKGVETWPLASRNKWE